MFNVTKGPIFLKESSSASNQLPFLQSLQPYLNKKGQTLLANDIKKLEYEIAGEKAIDFELENSQIPMYVLRDVYLEHKGLSAQIDYLIFTKKVCFVLEIKNIYGNIQINDKGEFTRSRNINGVVKREAIHSPITQNQRHLNVMKKVFIDHKTNVFMKFSVNKSFADFYQPVVVLANPHTIIDKHLMQNELKDQVIRTDQLNAYIEKIYRQSKGYSNSKAQILKLAQFYLNMHKDIEKDYAEKYSPYKLNKNIPETERVAITESDVYQELRLYRLNKSQQEQMKPYDILTNEELIVLIKRMPQNIDELKTINGFDIIKAAKFGEEVLAILNKYI